MASLETPRKLSFSQLTPTRSTIRGKENINGTTPLENFDTVIKKIKEENDMLRLHEAEEQRIKDELVDSRNLLLQKSQEEIAILKLAQDEMKEQYEDKLQNQKEFYEKKLQSVIEGKELSHSLSNEADKARLDAKESKIKKKYEMKLKKYEKLLKNALESCKHKQTSVTGALEEARHEIQQLKLQFEFKETTLRDEICLKDKRLTDIQQRLQVFSDVQKYGKIWKDNAVNIAYAYIHLCSTSTVETEEDNFSSYLSSFDKIFASSTRNQTLQSNNQHNVNVNGKTMKKLLKQAKVCICILLYLYMVGLYMSCIYIYIYI